MDRVTMVCDSREYPVAIFASEDKAKEYAERRNFEESISSDPDPDAPFTVHTWLVR